MKKTLDPDTFEHLENIVYQAFMLGAIWQHFQDTGNTLHTHFQTKALVAAKSRCAAILHKRNRDKELTNGTI